MVLCNTGTISSHFLFHPAWKIQIFYLDGPHNLMMQRDSSGTEFPSPCLKLSSYFLVSSVFPTSKVSSPVFHLVEKKHNFVFNTFTLLGLARLLVCAVFKNKKWQLSLLERCSRFLLLPLGTPLFLGFQISSNPCHHSSLSVLALTCCRKSPILWEVPKLYVFFFSFETLK